MAARTKAAVVVVVVVVVLGVVTVVVFAALCVRINRLDKSASVVLHRCRAARLILSTPRVRCERCSRSPLTNQSVMMMSRGSQKNASKEGRLSTLSFRVYVMGKNDATKADRQKDRPFRAFFSRPLATCFPHFRCQQYLNTSHRVIRTSHAVYI